MIVQSRGRPAHADLRDVALFSPDMSGCWRGSTVARDEIEKLTPRPSRLGGTAGCRVII